MAKKTDISYFGNRAEATRRRKLFEAIEHLEGEIRLAEDSLRLQEQQLSQHLEQRLAQYQNGLLKPLERQRLLLQEPEETARELLARRLPAIQQRQRLAYRKLRQDLRRKEGLLTREGRLLEGKILSEASEKELAAFQQEQQQGQEAIYQRLLARAREKAPAEKEKAALKEQYQQALSAAEAMIRGQEQALLQKDQAKLSALRSRQQARVEKLKSALKSRQKQLAESESQAKHHLPPDVCLRLDGLSMVFGGLKAVDDLSFDVKQGEIFGLIGPNGAGKTTVFNCITQFYKPTAGNILYRTKEGNVLRLNNYEVHKIITKGIVRTFQNVEVIGELSVLENLLIAAHPQYRASIWQQIFNTKRVRQEEQVIRQRALQVLEYCGLTAVKDLSPLGQPYGILKRIELARTLMAGANLIILDEPAAGLNEQETIELAHLIRKIQKDYHVTIFLVEHNMSLVMDLCDNICAISFGKKLAYGTPAEIQNDPVVQEAYLGTSDQKELEVIS